LDAHAYLHPQLTHDRTAAAAIGVGYSNEHIRAQAIGVASREHGDLERCR
jgi:hypothetical protein